MKNSTSLCFLIVSFFITFKLSYSQDLNYYIQSSRYNIIIKENSPFNNYDFIGHAYIDKNNKGIIDYNLLKKRLLHLYPNKTDSAVLVINLENEIYTDLKNRNEKKRGDAVKKFIGMVQYVKKIRPNLQIGLYGIPFRFNYKFQKNQNHKKDLLLLLKEVDFLAPDLYFSYGRSEQSDEAYNRILNENLDLFIEFAEEINKPIKFFVWYKIHPYNKKYGRTDVDRERLQKLIKVISKRKMQYNSIDGILWWESWEPINNDSRNRLTKNLFYYINDL